MYKRASKTSQDNFRYSLSHRSTDFVQISWSGDINRYLMRTVFYLSIKIQCGAPMYVEQLSYILEFFEMPSETYQSLLHANSMLDLLIIAG